MGVLASCPRTLDWSACPPIDTSGDFWFACLQSHHQTSPPSPAKFRNPMTTFKLPLFVPPKITFLGYVESSFCCCDIVGKLAKYPPPHFPPKNVIAHNSVHDASTEDGHTKSADMIKSNGVWSYLSQTRSLNLKLKWRVWLPECRPWSQIRSDLHKGMTVRIRSTQRYDCQNQIYA